MKKKPLVILPGILLTLSIVLELAANLSEDFAVFFTDNIFLYITLPLSFISSVFPFSVGECLLYLLAIIVLIFIPVLLISKLNHKRYFIVYLNFLWCIIGVYSLIMVLNCFILYQTPAMQAIKTVSAEDTELLIELRDKVVLRANELSTNISPKTDKAYLEETAINSLHKLAAKVCSGQETYDEDSLSKDSHPMDIRSKYSLQNTFHRLAGYYPHYKTFNNPAFFSQQYIMGYYFPFSMEANVNGIMYHTNFPHTICHEYAHLKGFIREDEANFVAFLACMNSEDEYFEYSALLSVITYLDNDFYSAIEKDNNIYMSHPQISDQVINDDIFLTKEAWNWVNDHSILNTETVRKASNSFTNTILTSNGVSDGMKSYSRVVGLLLDYYKNNPDFLN